MNYLRSIFLVCIVISNLALMISAEAQEGRYYDLVCRKGDNSVWVNTKEGNSIELTLRFQRSTVPAARRNDSGGFVGYNDLQPGECSWKYRTIRNDEPSNIKLLFENYTLFVATIADNAATLKFQTIPERPERLSPAQRFLSTIASYTLLGERPSEPEQNYYTIKVRNAGRHFEVLNDRYNGFLSSTRPGRDI